MYLTASQRLSMDGTAQWYTYLVKHIIKDTLGPTKNVLKFMNLGTYSPAAGGYNLALRSIVGFLVDYGC